MTLPFSLYIQFSILASLLLTGLFLWHLRFAVHRYRHHTTGDYAGESASILVSVVFVVAGVGLVISSLGRVFEISELGTIGLSMARGALLIGAVTLVVIDRHRK